MSDIKFKPTIASWMKFVFKFKLERELKVTYLDPFLVAIQEKTRQLAPQNMPSRRHFENNQVKYLPGLDDPLETAHSDDDDDDDDDDESSNHSSQNRPPPPPSVTSRSNKGQRPKTYAEEQAEEIENNSRLKI